MQVVGARSVPHVPAMLEPVLRGGADAARRSLCKPPRGALAPPLRLLQSRGRLDLGGDFLDVTERIREATFQVTPELRERFLEQSAAVRDRGVTYGDRIVYVHEEHR